MEKVLVVEKRLERFRDVLKKRQKDLAVFVEKIRNEHNFSAILRTCDAVGVLRVYYSYDGDELPINDSVTLGAHRWLLLEEVRDVVSHLKSLKELGFQIVATSLRDESINFRELDYTKPTVIVVGNELMGVSDEVVKLADFNVVVPMMGMVQSLNVSVATAVILYEAQRQRLEKGMYHTPTLSEEETEYIIQKWAYEDVIHKKRAKR